MPSRLDGRHTQQARDIDALEWIRQVRKKSARATTRSRRHALLADGSSVGVAHSQHHSPPALTAVADCMQSACMTVITIRDVSDETNTKLKARAANHGLSVQQFLHREIERLANESTIEERLRDVLAMAPAPQVSREQFRAAMDQFRRERDE